MQSLWNMRFGMPERDAVEECHPNPVERPPFVRGVYRPLTLREVYADLHEGRPPFTKSCPTEEYFDQTWGHVDVHLARLRHLYGPHVHLLDFHTARRFINRPLYCIAARDLFPCLHQKRQSWRYWTRAKLRAHLSLMIPRYFERESTSYRPSVIRAVSGSTTLKKARSVEAIPPPPSSTAEEPLRSFRAGRRGILYQNYADPVYVLMERMA